MALHYEYSQNSGRNLDYVWFLDNANMLIALSEHLDVSLAQLSPNIRGSMDTLPVVVGEYVLSHIFDSVDWEEIDNGGYQNPERIEIYDALFDLISSDKWSKSKHFSKLNNELYTLAFCLGSDLYLVDEEGDDDDPFEEEDEDSDDFEESLHAKLMTRFDDTLLTLHLYSTEEVAEIVMSLMKIKLILKEIEEEFNEESCSDAA